MPPKTPFRWLLALLFEQFPFLDLSKRRSAVSGGQLGLNLAPKKASKSLFWGSLLGVAFRRAFFLTKTSFFFHFLVLLHVAQHARLHGVQCFCCIFCVHCKQVMVVQNVLKKWSNNDQQSSKIEPFFGTVQGLFLGSGPKACFFRLLAIEKRVLRFVLRLLVIFSQFWPLKRMPTWLPKSSSGGGCGRSWGHFRTQVAARGLQEAFWEAFWLHLGSMFAPILASF